MRKVKEFDAISVREIIDPTNVGRGPFYAHYDNKEDLLESGFGGLLVALQERQREAASRGADLKSGSSHLAVICWRTPTSIVESFPATVSKRALIQHLVAPPIGEDCARRRESHGLARPTPAEATVEFSVS